MAGELGLDFEVEEGVDFLGRVFGGEVADIFGLEMALKRWKMIFDLEG